MLPLRAPMMDEFVPASEADWVDWRVLPKRQGPDCSECLFLLTRRRIVNRRFAR